MDDNVVWCALILAVAYVSRNMLPSYYEITSVRRHSLDNMRDDIIALEDRADAISDAVDDNKQDLMDALNRIEALEQKAAGLAEKADD